MEDAVVIVGRGLAVPGALEAETFWGNIIAGRDEFAPPPAGRWVLPPDSCLPGPGMPAGPDQVSSLNGCFVHSLGLPANLSLPRDLVSALDPMFHLLLYAGYGAWSEAETETLDPARVSVICGNVLLPTSACARLGERFFADVDARRMHPLGLAQALDTQVGGLPAALLAQALGVGGGSYTLDAACASSLYALALGCDELRTRRVDAVVVGGLSRADALYTQMGFSALHALSRRGRCTPFDAQADGLVVGEGCAMFVLKRLRDAVTAGDRIYAAIAGIGLSNDTGGTLMAPDSEGQVRALQAAYRQANWHPHEVGLVECHGTGTPVGDAVEVQSLRATWRGCAPEASAVIGSVKGNIGHLLTGAGAAGLFKVLLALEHEVLPPTAGFETSHESLDLGPFEILAAARAWPPPPGHPRRAAVSAFGFGGINGHVLLEQWNVGAPSALTPRTHRAATTSIPEPIAVVGLGAHFGPWSTRAEVTRRFSETPPGPERGRPHTPNNWFGHPAANAHPGHYIEGFEIAAVGLRIPPRELVDSLPQQLLALKVVAEALADADIAVEQPNPRCGVFLGTGLDLNTTNFTTRWEALANRGAADAGPSLTANRTMGSLGSISASRVARAFRAGGPSFTVSSAETSGLTALDLAARALRHGSIDVAIVAAVDLAGDPRAVLARAAVHTPAQADTQPLAALPIGEGAGAAVLMRAADATQLGKPQYAEITAIERRTDAIHSLCGAPGGSCNADLGQVEDTLAYATAQKLGHCGTAHGMATFVHAIFLLSADADIPRPVSFTVGSALGSSASLALRAPPNSTSRPLPDPSPPAPAVGHGPVPTKGHELRFENRPNPRANAPAKHPQLAPVTIAAPLRAPGAAGSPPQVLGLAEHIGRAALGAGTAHARFLALAAEMHQTIARLATVPQPSAWPHPAPSGDTLSGRNFGATIGTAVAPPRVFQPGTSRDPEGRSELDRKACLEFAVGRVANVLGPRFAAVDELPSRVRLPDEPLMLVDRIVCIDARPESLEPGRVVTEHDVHPGSWYIDAGRVPTCIAVEAGQADLFLSAYLGIDSQTQGLAVYRLLDAAVTFGAGLPRAGAVLRYDIRITRFFRLGPMHMFRFEFDASADGVPLMQMRDGCAGFFSAEDLAAGRGLIEAPSPRAADAGRAASVDWNLAARPRGVESFDEASLDALRGGQLGDCFGDNARAHSSEHYVPLPGGRMRLVHRITALDGDGGRFGNGLIVGEADIAGDEWFLTCHFIDDEVMPGTLMYECCLHTLRVYLLRYGWTSGDPGIDGIKPDLWFEPIPGITSRLRCRGQVTEATNTVQYEIHIKSLDYGPDGSPKAIADAVMCADHRPIVHMENLCIRLRGATQAGLSQAWSSARRTAVSTHDLPSVVFSHAQVLEFASGMPSKAFAAFGSLGRRYAPFDTGRTLARLPRPPFNFIHRVTRTEACEPGVLAARGKATAAFDAHHDDWYFDTYRDHAMPYAVLMEVGLQACGWLAAFMGSALDSSTDLAFRNLEGSARMHARLLRPAPGHRRTLETDVELLEVSQAAQMIIERFRFCIRDGATKILGGETTFGFFTAAALAHQSGIANPEVHRSPEVAPRNLPTSHRQRLLLHAVPQGRLEMLETLDFYDPRGGSEGLGLLRASARVDSNRWYFEAHFYQDPVCPGSLGLEAFLQLVRIPAIYRWGDRLDLQVDSRADHQWWYRGQILPSNQRYTVEVTVTGIDDATRTLEASGLLSVDGLPIYRMEHFFLTAD